MTTSADDPPADNLAILSKMGGDTSGPETFGRYVWQAKMAVREWLNCLTSGGPVAVVCEKVEDIVVVSGHLTFVQLKTRDRGSWSAVDVCSPGKGLDALVRSFKLAKVSGALDRSTFELWLEGPEAPQKATRSFFSDPSSASTDIRKRVRALGLTPQQTTKFLSKLSIRPNQPARSTIDAVILRSIGAIWPSMSAQQMDELYASLLAAAEKRQTASPIGGAGRSPLSDALAQKESDLLLKALESQTLTRTSLADLTPPLPGESDASLLVRARAQSRTALELKLLRAGASASTVQQAVELRANAEVKRQLKVAAGTSSRSFEALAQRLLTTSRASAERSIFSGLRAQARSADFVTADLLSKPTELAHLDRDRLFEQDYELVFGYLCQLSDECRFGWRASSS